MSLPVLTFSHLSPLLIECDVLVIGVRKTDSGPVMIGQQSWLSQLGISLSSIGVTGAQDELRRLPGPSGPVKSLALIGMGTGSGQDDELTDNDLRYAAGSAVRQLLGVESVVLTLPAESDRHALAVLEGAAIGAYSYAVYRSVRAENPQTPASLVTVVSSNPNPALLVEARAIAQAVHTVRDLVNAPPNDLYPATFSSAVHALAEGLPLDVTVLDAADLEAGGYGGLVGVGQGSARGPRLVKITYSPTRDPRSSQHARAIERPGNPEASDETEQPMPHVALVGKGITFDSGGLSLKAPASMIGMKYDMAGAAVALAVVIAAARLELKVKVTSWLCIAENLPSGSAMRPNDVITIRGGKTVEVLNTDAEGRLVLADGLVSASEEEPDAIVDIATLTGAASIAMGNRYVPAMGNDTFLDTVIAAADRVGETFWPMPIPAELRPMLASDIADIANVKPGNTAGGMLIAAAFLQEFVGSTGVGVLRKPISWVHLDIAGAANNGSGGWGYTGKGPTGVSVRALIELISHISRS